MLSKLLLNKSLFKFLSWLWLGVSLALFFMPSDQLQIASSMNDKAGHALMFAGGIGGWYFYLRSKITIYQIGSCLLIYGVAVEFVQGSLPVSFHRGADFSDAAADFVGVLIGGAVSLILEKKFIQ